MVVHSNTVVDVLRGLEARRDLKPKGRTNRFDESVALVGYDSTIRSTVMGWSDGME